MMDAAKEDWYEANERVMENAEEYWKQERARWAAVKKRLCIPKFGRSDAQIAEAWRDLGFPLKAWMKEVLP